MKAKQLLTISITFLFVALALHVWIFVGVERFPFSLDVLLTGGMVLVWLFSSRLFKQLHKNEPAESPFKLLQKNVPFWLPPFVAFTGLYALINMGMMIRTRWAGSNLRGISGFWIFFFALGVLISWAKIRQERQQKQTNSN